MYTNQKSYNAIGARVRMSYILYFVPDKATFELADNKTVVTWLCGILQILFEVVRQSVIAVLL